MSIVDMARPESIQIFLDESGDNVSYTLAGVIGAAENWTGFASTWQQVMSYHGLSGVALHMRELQGSAEEPWLSLRTDKDRSEHLLNDLADVLINRKIALFGATLLIAEYEAQGSVGKSRWPNPYKLCFETVIGAAEETCDPAPGGKIYLTFDKGCNEGWANQAYAKIKAKASADVFADHASFEDDREYPELCAADMVAYELRRATYNYYTHGKNELRPFFQKLALRVPHVFWKVNFANVIASEKVIHFPGVHDGAAEIFLYQDDPKP